MSYPAQMSVPKKVIRPRPSRTDGDRAVIASRPSENDLREQSERIKNLEADTDMKLQSLRQANIQLAVSILAVLGTLVGVVVGAIAVFLDRHDIPKPAPTFIFLSPTQETVL